MRESFEDDHAADRAVAQVVRDGLFRPEHCVKFDCYRVMDTIEDFREWLDDFIAKGNFESHDWLVHRVQSEVELADGRSKIVVSAPLVLQALRKNNQVI